MTLFLSTYTNKVDRKGRVSVPAAFRAALTDADGAASLVLFRSHTHMCLEGFPYAIMQELSERLDHFDLFSAAQDDLATTIFGEAVNLPIDNDGRIILPQDLIIDTGLEEHAAFVGMGRKFQIWNPIALTERRREARAQVRVQGLTLPRTDSARTDKAGGAS